MKIGDIFDLSQYREAFIFAKNNNLSIKDLGNKMYQIVEIPVVVPTIEEQNESIRATREQLYIQTSDKLKADYDEAVARGSENAEELRQAWLDSKDKIREENPYVVEESEEPEEVVEPIYFD